MERDGNGSKFCFYQKGEHIEYILWLHGILLENGYCKENLPQIQTRSINGKLSYYCRFRTFTYSSFNWIYEAFYIKASGEKGIKKVPIWIERYLSPIALAIWIMHDWSLIKDRGIKLSTGCFSVSDVKYLIFLLETEYNMNLAIHSTGKIGIYLIYIAKKNLPVLIPAILPHMHPYFLYKLNMVKANL